MIKWTGIPAVPPVTSQMASFLQALKNNLGLAQAAIDSTPTTVTTTTTTTTGGSGSAPPSILDYGGVADGVTNNDAAFVLAEASVFDEIYIPSGTFLCSTRLQTQFNKVYHGPGSIVLSDGTVMPGSFAYMASYPTPAPLLGVTGYFKHRSGKLGTGEWHIVGPGARQSLLAQYYESAFQVKSHWMHVYDGGSGLTCRMTTPASAGATSITVDGAFAGLVGKAIGFGTGMDGPFTETKTVLSVGGTTTINLTAPLVSGWPAGTTISTSRRTQTAQDYTLFRNFAGEGDVYGSVVRAEQRYVRKAGQSSPYETSTVGLYGGDVTFVAGSDMSGGTGWEVHYADGGCDVSCYAQIDEFLRNNDTGAGATTWVGHLLTSAGTKYADAAISIAGFWRFGLDLARADFGTNVTPGDQIQAAISTALGHRWVMNSSTNPAGRGYNPQWGPQYGNKPGDMYIESGNDGISDFIALRFNRAGPNNGRLRVRPNAVQANVDFNCATSISAGQDISVGATNRVYFGAGSTNYIQFNGTNFIIVKGGVTVATF